MSVADLQQFRRGRFGAADRPVVPFCGGIHRPSELSEVLALGLSTGVELAVRERAVASGLPLALWLRFATEAEEGRALVGTQIDDFEGRLDAASAAASCEPLVVQSRALIEYSRRLQRAAHGAGPQPSSGEPLMAKVSREHAARWRRSAAAAGVEVSEWIAGAALAAPGRCVDWEMRAAREGRTVLEWAVREALATIDCDSLRDLAPGRPSPTTATLGRVLSHELIRPGELSSLIAVQLDASSRPIVDAAAGRGIDVGHWLRIAADAVRVTDELAELTGLPSEDVCRHLDRAAEEDLVAEPCADTALVDYADVIAGDTRPLGASATPITVGMPATSMVRCAQAAARSGATLPVWVLTASADAPERAHRWEAACARQGMALPDWAAVCLLASVSAAPQIRACGF